VRAAECVLSQKVDTVIRLLFVLLLEGTVLYSCHLTVLSSQTLPDLGACSCSPGAVLDDSSGAALGTAAYKAASP
jgi:hypothetical protein